MSFKTSLAGGAALGLALALSSGFAAQAATRHHHRAVRHVARADGSAQLQSQIDELKSEVQSLKAAHDAEASSQAQNQAQIDQLKGQLADADARAQAAQQAVDAQIQTIPGEVKAEVAKNAPKTDKIYVHGASLQFGGFTALETVFRSHAETADMASSFSAIPFAQTPAGHTAETRFSARQSRISALAQANVSDTIKISGYGEFDFLGAAQTANSNESNSYTPRIRNLYTTIDWMEGPGTLHLLAGQSWSLVTLTKDGLSPRTELSPLTIEAQYVPGFSWARQPQVRLSYTTDNHISVGLSVEQAQTTFYSSGNFIKGVTVVNTEAAGSGFNSANSLSLNKWPDIVGKLAADENLAGHNIHAEVYGLYRNFYARIGVPGSITNESTSGGGVGAGIYAQIVPSFLDLQLSGLTGKGIGRYGAGQLPDATIDVNGNLHPINEWQALVGLIGHVGTKLDIYAYGGEEREKSYASVNGTIYNGIGNPFYNNSGCDTEGTSSSTCVGNTHYLTQITAGFWHRAYAGPWGRFQWGIQYSHTERDAFLGQGGAPVTHDDMVFTSFRFYPFQ
jgi:hypothetical protein